MHLFRRPELQAANAPLTASARPHAHLAAGLALLGLLSAAAAQGPADGALSGLIQDPRGDAIPSARLTLRNLETGELRSLPTARDGTFLLPHLTPGSYALSVTAPGFALAPDQPIEVPLGQTLELRTTLRLATVSTSVQVQDQQVHVQGHLQDQVQGQVQDPVQDQAQPGATQTLPAVEAAISSADLALLPSNGRRWEDFALTLPGALPDENQDGLLSLHGLATTQNSALLDGAEANQSFNSVPVGTGANPAPDPNDDSDSADLTTGPSHGLGRGRHAGVAYTFSQSAVKEFRLAGPSYSAQTGRAGGAVITTVSHAGTTNTHGSASFLLRSDLLATKNPLSIATAYTDGVVASSIVKPHDLRENYAATLGGPIPRARELFYFYTFDGQRRGFPAISSPQNPSFYILTPVQSALLANRGVSRTGVNAALDYLSSLTGATPRRADQTLNFARADWQQHPRLTLGLQDNSVRWSAPAGLIDAPVVARGRASLGNSAGSVDALLLRITGTLTARTLNQAHVQFLRDLQYETPQPALPQEPAIGPGGLVPEVNIGPDGLLFGTPAGLSQSAYPDERRIEIGDALTLVRGQHLIEFGASVSFVDDRVATLSNAAGTFRYDSANTRGYAGGLVDFVTDYTFNVHTIPNGGCPSIVSPTHLFCFRSYSQSFGEDRVAFPTQEWAGFVEDTWRLRPGLTLHAGVRYEYTLLPIPQKPNAALDALLNTLPGAHGATNVFPEDRNNLGPRLSISYEPFGSGRGTIHLGYGFFFGRLPGATIRSALSDTALPSSSVRVRITPATVTACPQVQAQGFGYPCSFLMAPPGVVATTTSAMVFDRGFRLPVVQQGSLSLQRSVHRGTTLSATYVLNLDRQLSGSTDLNIAPSTQTAEFQLQGGTGAVGVRDGETFLLPVYTSRISPSFGPITDILSHGNGTYNGLVLSVDSQLHPGLSVRGNYTWSKAIDYAQSLSATPRTYGQLDPFAIGYDKGLSSLNYPWALHAVAVWTPRVRAAERWVRRIANGWEVAPILAARSGRPYSLDLFGGTRLPGGHESLNGSGGALYLPTVGRNTLRLPANITADLRAGRTFTLDSRLRVRASAEAFNVFNHRNVSSVTQRAYDVGTAAGGVTPLVFQSAAAIAAAGLNTQPFGTPTAAGTSLARERQIQLSLRLEF